MSSTPVGLMLTAYVGSKNCLVGRGTHLLINGKRVSVDSLIMLSNTVMPLSQAPTPQLVTNLGYGFRCNVACMRKAGLTLNVDADCSSCPVGSEKRSAIKGTRASVGLWITLNETVMPVSHGGRERTMATTSVRG